MSENDLGDKQQERLIELFLKFLEHFKRYKPDLPNLDSLRQRITDLDAQLKQSGNLELQTDKKSQLDQTNQLINAIALNQEILKLIQQEIVEITSLKDAEKEASLKDTKSETPKGPSLADQYDKRLLELIQLEEAAKQQEAALKAKIEKLSKDLDKARSDRDDKYEKVVEAEANYEGSKVKLEKAHQALNTSEIEKAELVQQRKDNVDSFDLYVKEHKEDIKQKIEAQLTTEAIGAIAVAAVNSKMVDPDPVAVEAVKTALKEKAPEINSAKSTHVCAQGRYVAEGVDSRFFKESRADFAAKMEEERKAKGNSELDHSIDSVLQGAAGPLTLAQFNATRDGLETSIAAALTPKLGSDSSAAAKKVADEYFASGMTVSITDDLRKKASENAVSAQQMANADSNVIQADAKVKKAESTLTERATEVNTAVTNLASAQDNVLAKETAQLQLQVDRSQSSIAAVSPEASRVDTSKHNSDEVATKIKSIKPNPTADIEKAAEQAKALALRTE